MSLPKDNHKNNKELPPPNNPEFFKNSAQSKDTKKDKKSKSFENQNTPSAENYKVTESGLYYHPPKKPDEDSPSDPIFISSPIYPEAYLRDKDGKSHALLIKVFDGEVAHLWPMPRKTIADLRDLIGTLLDLGQNVPLNNLSNQKHLQTFLMTSRPQQKFRCVNKAGWHGEQYVFPDGTIIGNGDEGESVYPITQLCPEGIKTKGTLEEWQDNVVSICRGNSRMIFALGVAFAAPCAELVDEDSGGFNLKGKSSIGKTRCLKIAVSVFGSPEYKRSWKATSNALEGTCSLYNDALLPLDEFGQSNALEAGETAYMISQGMGKGRMKNDSSLKKIKTWRLLVLSTGETGLEEHMCQIGKQTKAGQTVRFPDIPAEVAMDADNTEVFGCFENIHEDADGASFADKIDEVCGNYYGTASRSFIEKLINNLDEAKKHLKYSVEDFVADNSKGCHGQIARVTRRFGLVYAALSLCIQYGITGSHISDEEAKKAVLKCYKAWLETRDTSGDLESHQIIEFVIGKLQEYSDSKFLCKNLNSLEEKKTYQQIWGYKESTIFYVTTYAFKTYFCNGQSPTVVAKTLCESGHLERGKDKRYSINHRIPNHNKEQDRFYTINIESGN